MHIKQKCTAETMGRAWRLTLYTAESSFGFEVGMRRVSFLSNKTESTVDNCQEELFRGNPLPTPPHSQDKSLLGALFFLLMGNSSIFSSPSSDTYSYSSRTGLALSSLKLCKVPNTPGLLGGLRALEL